MKSIRFPLPHAFVALVVCALVGGLGAIQVSAQDKKKEAAPAVPSTLSEFEVRITRNETGSDMDEEAFKDHVFGVKVYNVEDPDGDGRWGYVVATGDLEASSDVPLGSVHIGREFTVELEHPVGRLISRAIVPYLDHGVDMGRVTALSKGFETASAPDIGIHDKVVPVEYTAAARENDAKLIDYSVKLSQTPYTHVIGTVETSLTDLSRRLVFEKESQALTQATWFKAWTRKFGAELSRTYSQTIEIKRKSTRELKPEETKTIHKEYQLLDPIVASLLPGGGDMVRRGKASDALRKKLSRYEKDYKENGAFLAVVPELQRRLGKVLKRAALPEDPEEVARMMKGKKAPDFTLKTLDGKKVKLSSFKGKGVLLNFWALL